MGKWGLSETNKKTTQMKIKTIVLKMNMFGG